MFFTGFAFYNTLRLHMCVLARALSLSFSLFLCIANSVQQNCFQIIKFTISLALKDCNNILDGLQLYNSSSCEKNFLQF